MKFLRGHTFIAVGSLTLYLSHMFPRTPRPVFSSHLPRLKFHDLSLQQLLLLLHPHLHPPAFFVGFTVFVWQNSNPGERHFCAHTADRGWRRAHGLLDFRSWRSPQVGLCCWLAVMDPFTLPHEYFLPSFSSALPRLLLLPPSLQPMTLLPSALRRSSLDRAWPQTPTSASPRHLHLCACPYAFLLFLGGSGGGGREGGLLGRDQPLLGPWTSSSLTFSRTLPQKLPPLLPGQCFLLSWVISLSIQTYCSHFSAPSYRETPRMSCLCSLPSVPLPS